MGIDAYQLTTLVAHADAGRLAHDVRMAFFFRKLPRARNYVVFCGLRRILEHAAQMAFGERDMASLRAHPMIGPALATRPDLVRALGSLQGFEGSIDALPEGTLAFAGPALRADGTPFVVAGAPLCIYTPMIQIRTDMVRAKLIETPWLGFLNHGCMVASKAARVVDAAAGKSVLEFGARRTHPDAGLDASYAAYLAGCSATSNLAAYDKYGVPAAGTMDHFAVQASEKPGRSPADAELDFFAIYARAFADPTVLLVDTYDTQRGIVHAVSATAGKLGGIRLDSNVTVDTVKRARAILADLGAPHAKIFVSDGLDEYRVRELAPFVDGFGVGENISCSPDAATGVGAVAKLVVNGYGKTTMKLANGSGKATLPGEVQAYRFSDHDWIALASEDPPSMGRPLLQPVWRGNAPVAPLPSLEVSRAHVRQQIEALPSDLRALEPATHPRRLVASDALARQIERLAKEAIS